MHHGQGSKEDTLPDPAGGRRPLQPGGCGGTSDITLPSAEPRTPYRLATYRASDAGDGSPRPAIVIGETILDLAAADALFATEISAQPHGFPADLIAVIAAGDRAHHG